MQQSSIRTTKGFLITLLLFFISHSYAQILKSYAPGFRINQSVLNQTRTDSLSFAGNYKVLNLKSPENQSLLDSIADCRSGTLFLVIKPLKEQLSDRRLLKIGDVSVYKDYLLVDGAMIRLNRIKDEPVILKVNFQTRQSRRWFTTNCSFREDEIDLAEVIYYDQILSKEDARIVESHLALKYSINISVNKNPKLRDYYSRSNNIIWSHRTDGLFDKEIMGLGRLDVAGFYQSQTYTSDSKSMMVSLDTPKVVSGMPRLEIQDSSMLVISKGKSWNKNTACGTGPSRNFWKIKLIDWYSGAQEMIMDIDSSVAIYNPVITDGVNNIAIGIQKSPSRTILTVPVGSLDPNGTYFIRASIDTLNCTPYCNVSLQPCDTNKSGRIINIGINKPQVLPQLLTLVNIYSGDSIVRTITNPFSQISNVGPGVYHLLVQDSTWVLADTILVVDSCIVDTSVSASMASGNGGTGFNDEQTPLGFEQFANDPDKIDENAISGDPSVATQTKKTDLSQNNGPDGEGINAYPNPSTRNRDVQFELVNLNDIPFEIQVFDSKGALLRSSTFTPTNAERTFQLSFTELGTYQVRFMSEKHTATKQVLIQPSIN